MEISVWVIFASIASPTLNTLLIVVSTCSRFPSLLKVSDRPMIFTLPLQL